MEDPQEYKSLDELFRKTFEELPESPAASGWDAPSPRVWEQVQANITPPKGGWTTQSLLLLSGFAVVLLLGLYWAFAQLDSDDSNTTETKTELPTASVDSKPATTTLPTTPSENASTKDPSSASANKKQTVFIPARPAKTKPQSEENQLIESLSENGLNHRNPAGSAPLPGSVQAPNTTIRRQMEAYKNAPWAQPMQPLPTLWDLQKQPKPIKNLIPDIREN